MAPRVRVRDVRVYLRHVRTRIHFRYGKAVVTGQPYGHVRADIEVGRASFTGVSAAALPPAWFDKSPGRTHEDDVRDLLRSVRVATEVYGGAPAETPFGLRRACEPEARRRCAAEGMNELTAGFGVALLDAAAIDAVCRFAGRTFHEGLRGDLFGVGADIARQVPDRPLDRIWVRHTVGMGDPIVAADAGSRVNDGLPETLEEVVRDYRVRYFKIKVSSDREASLDRLRRITAVLDRDAGDYQVTLDGNEQFHDMGEALEFARAAAADPSLATLWRRTLWIEQPVERGAALTDAVAAPLGELDKMKAVILDESDGTDEAVGRALALGYRGISAKNCKGVYRTLHSCVRTRETNTILSSEDLMNIPVVPLHQDLCVAAALGIPHSERNGHHYIRAFEYFSPRERDAALREYPSLYRPAPPGPPALRIEGGALDLREINRQFFGVLSEPDWDSLDMIK